MTLIRRIGPGSLAGGVNRLARRVSALIDLRRRAVESPHLVALVAIVLLGALLRFSTLDLQSYRYDEALTAGRVLHPSLFTTLSVVPNTESTPPFYFFTAWLWSRPLGTGEVALRSLSALAGTATIVVVYLGATTLLPRRVGLIAAAIVAVNPVMIWFSQDARSYALAMLLTALSFLFFAKALRSPSKSLLSGWAISSALAIATHYFTGFVIGPEALILLGAGRERRRVALAAAGILVVVALLIPIGLEQAGTQPQFNQESLGHRLERAAAKFVGDDNGDEHGARQPGPIPLIVPIGLAIAGLAMLIGLGDRGERRGAGIAAAVGVAGLLAPLLLVAFGADFLDGRNLLPTYIPLTIVLAAGFGARRAGLAGLGLAAAFCAMALIFTIEIDRLPRLQREDLRNAAQQLGPARGPRAIVSERYSSNWQLRYYLGARPATRADARLGEIDVVGSRAAIQSHRSLLPAGFRLVELDPVSYNLTLARFRSPRPLVVPLRPLQSGALVGGGSAAVLLQGGAGQL
jgi:mannosyltransferase